MKEHTTHRVIFLDGREISYEWIRKKVKNINLRVRADGTVSVSSPRGVSQKQIEMFLTEKANFLFRALDAFERRKKTAIPPPTFREGDKIYLFGEEKTLCFFPVKDGEVQEKDGLLSLSFEENPEKIKQKLQKYAQKQLLELLFSYAKMVHSLFPETVKFPKIKLRAMRATWGNCRPKEGILTFNSRLACYPPSCIEYIVMHEFTHFLIPNHSAAFYAMLSEKMPDWQERKTRLNTCQIQPFF